MCTPDVYNRYNVTIVLTLTELFSDTNDSATRGFYRAIVRYTHHSATERYSDNFAE